MKTTIIIDIGTYTNRIGSDDIPHTSIQARVHPQASDVINGYYQLYESNVAAFVAAVIREAQTKPDHA